jgi:rare lipoprotein A
MPLRILSRWGSLLMLSSRVLTLACVSLFALSGVAAAQRAPITYAGQGGNAAPTQTASLTGGDDRSYGYGSSRRNSGAVIDIRRGSGARVERVRDEYPDPVPVAADDEEDAAPQPAAPQPTAAAPSSGEGAQPWLERERVGPPYEANGRWYVPTPEPGYAQTGTATWYGSDFHGRPTASGEVFDQAALTAAHPTLPIPSLVQVTNLENGREVIVRVNDRGPFVGDRLIDMSRAGAEALGFQAAGHARVHVRYLGPAPRRVNADGTQAPASASVPAVAAPVSAPVENMEEGPRSLLPPPSSNTDLAGGMDDEAAPAPMPAAPPQYASAAPSYTGAYVVQVGAYSDLANAHRVRDAVGAAGPVTVDVRRSASGAELFRVRVGPWQSREEADGARRTLATLGYGEAIVASR